MLYNLYQIGDKTQTVLASIEATNSLHAYQQYLDTHSDVDPDTLIAFPTEPTETPHA